MLGVDGEDEVDAEWREMARMLREIPSFPRGGRHQRARGQHCQSSCTAAEGAGVCVRACVCARFCVRA